MAVSEFYFVALKSVASSWRLTFERINNRVVIHLWWGDAETPAHSIEMSAEKFAELAADLCK